MGLLGVKVLVLTARFAEQVGNRECFHLVVKPEKYLQHFSQFMKGTITFLLALLKMVGNKLYKFFSSMDLFEKTNKHNFFL